MSTEMKIVDRLALTAPDLLKALQAIVVKCESKHNNCAELRADILMTARDAVEKAGSVRQP